MRVQFVDVELERAYKQVEAVEVLNAWLKDNPVSVISIETIVHDRFDHAYRVWYRADGEAA